MSRILYRAGVSRPTPRGDVEGSGGGGLQTHTRGGGVEESGRGVSRPTPRRDIEGSGQGGLRSTPRGCLQAHTQGVSRLTPGWVSRPTPRRDIEGSGQGGLRSTPRGVSRPTPRGSPGSHLGGSPGPHPGACVSQHALRQTPPPPPKQTATAAGGTHPTGMHSCLICILAKAGSFNNLYSHDKTFQTTCVISFCRWYGKYGRKWIWEKREGFVRMWHGIRGKP